MSARHSVVSRRGNRRQTVFRRNPVVDLGLTANPVLRNAVAFGQQAGNAISFRVERTMNAVGLQMHQLPELETV